MRRKILFFVLISFLFCQSPAYPVIQSSDTARFSRGFQRVLLSAFQLPFQTLSGTMRGPLGIGTVAGVLSGTIRTLTEISGGAFDMAAAAAPYAKYAVFF